MHKDKFVQFFLQSFNLQQVPLLTYILKKLFQYNGGKSSSSSLVENLKEHSHIIESNIKYQR